MDPASLEQCRRKVEDATGGGNREEAQRGLEEAADKADQHVLNLRQRMAEITERIYTDMDTGMNEDPWSSGEWQDAGGSWSGWQWDRPAEGVQARAGGERTALGMEVENLRGAAPALQQGQVDVQAGMAALIGELRGMAAADGFAAGGCASDACGEKPVQAESWTNVESVGAGDTKRDLQEGCGAKSGASWCQEIEDSEDELIAGAEDVAQQQQMQQHGRIRVFQSNG